MYHYRQESKRRWLSLLMVSRGGMLYDYTHQGHDVLRAWSRWWGDPRTPTEIWQDSPDELLQQPYYHQAIRWAAAYNLAVYVRASTDRSAPRCFFIWGNKDLVHEHLLGMVGPRAPSAYGAHLVSMVLDAAVQYRLATISWGAKWIDMLTHLGSLQRLIPTIVVLWSGLQRASKQRTARKQRQQIVDAWGAIISAYPMDQAPTRYTFPQRNKLIARLTHALYVPQAWKKSGSLITVDFALRINKPCYGGPHRRDDTHFAGLTSYFCQQQVTPLRDEYDMLEKHFTRITGAQDTQETQHPSQQVLVQETMISYNAYCRLAAQMAPGTIVERNILAQQYGRDTAQINALISEGEIEGLFTPIWPGKYTRRWYTHHTDRPEP